MIDGLTFEEEPHEYRFNGALVPSVTAILANAGVYKLGFDGQVMQYARELGQAVHKATELDDTGALDEPHLDPSIVPYLKAWRKFKKQTGFIVTGCEQRVLNEKFGYAGTLDRLGTLYQHSCIIDIKTGAKQRATGPQLAAYLAAASENDTGSRAIARFAVHLKPTAEFELVPYKNRNDFGVFQSCLNIWNWKNQ